MNSLSGTGKIYYDRSLVLILRIFCDRELLQAGVLMVIFTIVQCSDILRGFSTAPEI
jgi:hypothetical protein